MLCFHLEACVCPLQVALGVSVHNLCGSKVLLNIVNKLGFSSSVEVRKFERNASVLSQPEESLLFANDTDSRFSPYLLPIMLIIKYKLFMAKAHFMAWA